MLPLLDKPWATAHIIGMASVQVDADA